jgi:hypothetical protein
MVSRFLLTFVFSTLACLTQAQQVLKPEEIIKLIPTKVKLFYEDGDAKSSLIKMGDLRYSLCERKFVKGGQQIKILLFDYKEAPIMYKQAMRRWSNESIVTDSLVLRPLALDNCTGWEAYNRNNYTSQIFLGICDRFFLMVSGERVELKKLEEVVDLFAFKDFPK